jgi:aspartyl protease family protein
LKREKCDQTSVKNLSIALERLGYRREAGDSLYYFVLECGTAVHSLHNAIDIFLKLADYPKSIEIADEYIKREPQNANGHYLRAIAYQESGEILKALTDYADAIELFGQDRTKISSLVFVKMARAYATLGRFCEAATPILTWVAYDPIHRDTAQTQRMIADYNQKGNCSTVSTGPVKQRYPIAKRGAVITVKAEINGVKGNFLLDTGATFVTMKSGFGEKARISLADAREITLATANGPAKGGLTRADKVQLGGLIATNVPVVVQKTDDRSYGVNIDGLLGMSFLARFEVQLADSYVELRTRGATR